MAPSVVHMVHGGRAQGFEKKSIRALCRGRNVQQQEVTHSQLWRIKARKPEVRKSKGRDLHAVGVMLDTVWG